MTALRGIAPAALIGAAMAAALLAAPPIATAAPDPTPLAPCYNGITPFNPYADNCGLPSRPPRVLGSAPDQTAILNCSVGSEILRAICLSAYVNGGYPGFVFAPGLGR